MASEQNYTEKRRLELHTKLTAILGTNNVYFQPPESLKMNYPAIVYERADIKANHAGGIVYARGVKYRVTVIDTDPTSRIVEKISLFPTAKYQRNYKAEGLNHDVFMITY